VDHDRSRAADFARKALAWLDERAVPPTPDNFQLAYAYIEGSNTDLRRGFDALMAVGSKFDAQTMTTQHQRYFPKSDDGEQLAEFGDKVSAQLNSVLQLLSNASKDHTAYKQTLSSASDELENTRMAQDAVRVLVEQVIGATQAMEARTHELESKLNESSQEIVELRGRLEATQRDTLLDHLTGVANRRAFDIELKKRLDANSSSSAPLSVVTFDIDRFKLFNDTWGHQTGDQVLRFVAGCIADNSRPSDVTARYGGEEFSVILPATPLDDAVQWANRVCGIVRSKRLVKRSTGGSLGIVTVSAGVASHKAGENAVQFLRRADRCLYAAKQTGRDRVVSEGDTAILSAAETEAA
jgi:diguanylate cyclase